MPIKEDDFFKDVWAFNKEREKIFPYKGERGSKNGLFSVNFTNDTKKFVGLSEDQLIEAIISGKFRDRGTIRMLPINFAPGSDRNAFAPEYYKGKPVKDFG